MSLRTLTEALLFRSRLANVAGHTYGRLRDLYRALGYKRELFPPDYRSRYRRNAIANRLVKALPLATWRGLELIEDHDESVETIFEAEWKALDKRLRIVDKFRRADILAGIGRYSIIMMATPGNLEEPLESCSADEIEALWPFAEEDATIQTFETDVNNPRFGLPIFYTVKRTTMTSTTAINSATVGKRVHWTRIHHVADGLLDDNIYGEPRLECVWNLFDDLEKVTGGGSEAFWRRADGGTQFDIDPTLDVDETAQQGFQAQILEMEHGLKRNLLTRGMTINRLGSDVADFSAPVQSIISQISAGCGIPQRVLTGSEQGKLAAKQDAANWDTRVTDRQFDYASPCVVIPFVDRLIKLGAITEPMQYEASFSSTRQLDDEQRAVVAKQYADINNSMGETVILIDEIRRVLNYEPMKDVTDALPKPIVKAASAHDEAILDVLEAAITAGNTKVIERMLGIKL